MVPFFQRKSVRRFLTAFKWCRVAVLFALLLVVSALAYLHLVGLPDILKKPLLRTLRQRGFEARFASAHLGWGPSVIIENAAFSPTNQSVGPTLTSGRTQLDLNAAALLHGHIRVDAFEVQQGGLSIPVTPTNQGPLLLTNVELLVTLTTNNVAILTNCSAQSRGILIHVNGEARNFLSMRDWKLPVPPPARATNAANPAQPVSPGERLTAWQILQGIHFTGAPELNLHFFADGHDRDTLRAELDFTAAGAKTVWGHAGPVHLRAACNHLLNSGDAPFFQAHVQARDVTTRWASCRDVSASVDFSRDAYTNFSAFARVAGREVKRTWFSASGSNWVRVSDLRWVGNATLPAPTYVPEAFQGTLSAVRTDSGWGSVGAFSLLLKSRRTNDPSAVPAWSEWNKIKPFDVDWQADATNILTPKLKLNHVAFNGGWHPPQLTIDKLEADMYRGHLNASGNLEVASREVQARVAVDFDPHQISPLLTAGAQHWISLYDWETPPKFSGGLRFVLPPWTNRLDAWPEESRDSVQLAGDFSVGRGAFRGIGVTSAKSHYSYTNHVWNVSGLSVTAAGGSALDLDYTWSDLTSDYHFRFDSKVDPAVAVPLLTEPQKRTLRELSFPERPEIHADVWGNWRGPETVGFNGTLTAKNFLVREEGVDQLDVKLDYTNRLLRINQLNLLHPTGRVEVPLASIDFASNVYSMSNASARIDPAAVRRALGKIAPPWMKELQFDSPPLVKASGSFSPGDDSGTDLRFVVQGEHLHWNHLTADSVQGDVYYHFRTVDVTNLQAGLYKNGKLQGWFAIEWGKRGTRFNSDTTLKDINLAALAQELSAKRTKLEGLLNGHLTLGAPFSASDTNLVGSGWLHVFNGLLWDIKLFGALSPMLNAIAPGSGESRAREATASFVINNGVLSTDDLQIRSSGFRLLYRGTLDTKMRLNARVEANLLRDTPVFGHFLSWMLTPLDKLFEYRVTGTVQKPITKPLYIPKIFMEMLRPFHSMKELHSTTPPVAKPNSPPASTPVPTPSTPQN